MQICRHNNAKIRIPNYIYPLIGLLITLFYWVGTGTVQLFDWDEINFAEISREMIISGNYWQPTIDFVPFHEKPPLFSWLQSLSFQLFGVGEMAARLPNVLCGGLTLACLLYVGRRWHSNRFGVWWALFMGFSILPQLYFRSGIIDPWFNLFIFLSLITLISNWADELPGWKRLLSSGLLLGLAILTKGPVAGLIAALVLAIGLGLDRKRFTLAWYRYGLVGSLRYCPLLSGSPTSGNSTTDFSPASFFPINGGCLPKKMPATVVFRASTSSSCYWAAFRPPYLLSPRCWVKTTPICGCKARDAC